MNDRSTNRFSKIVLDHIPLTPQDILKLGDKFSQQVGTCLLYSGGEFDTIERTYLCLFPSEFIHVNGNKLQTSNATWHVNNPWEGLRDFFSSKDSDSSYPEWVGYFGYEMGATSDPDKPLPYHPSAIPDSFFLRPSLVISFDHKEKYATLLFREDSLKTLPEDQKRWCARFTNKTEWPKILTEELSTPPQNNVEPFSLATPIESPDSYRQKVERTKELIRSGEVYQVNLSQKFLLRGERDPYQIFCELASINPAPFMAYLRFPDFVIISSSPERFLSKRGTILETRPIKGTAPRGESLEQDLRNKEWLLSSPKERAELLMITDLMRNDLGKVSVTGSVKTHKIWECETYTNVHHLVSTISSQAKPQLHAVDILRSCFPGGSITGCPKLRAMEVISDIEQRARGIYTGSIGYLTGNGDFDFNIAIRTVLWKGGLIDVQLGGGIVSDSDPQKEYEETLHKGESLFKTLGLKELKCRKRNQNFNHR
ncbi:MAG: Aminodeoxychorismate synthase component 1 [Chlamydiae bacterium]|nr:Aminodeoxychorismate synthase component 1 [Chlamydiota bacterium]